MPDWCINELYVTGDVDQLRRFRDKTDGRKVDLTEKKIIELGITPSVLSFHQLMPIPYEVMARGFGAPDGTCDWQKSNWGVKWGACHVIREDGDNYLIYFFETAWAAPLEFIRKVSAVFPGLEFHLRSSTPETGWHEETVFRCGAEEDEYRH